MFKETPTTETTKTVIGSSVTVEGEFKGQGDVLVEGTLKGSLSTEHNVTIGSKAHVQATISAKDVFISGEVIGNITVGGHIELSKTARITGDIQATSIAVETGASIQGNCTVLNQQTNAKHSEKSAS